MKQENIDQLIIDYLNGRLNQTQKKELETWIASDVTNKQYYYEQTEIWLTTKAMLGQKENSTVAYLRFMRRIEQGYSKRWNLQKMTRYAASIFLFIGLIGASFYLGSQYDKQNIVASMQSVEVPFGSRTRIMLQDGTTVWLNAGSTLTYNSRFLHDNRNVTLEGEGYFEVTPNKELPFIVNTRKIDVKVLGTKFNIKAYSAESDVSVALVEGEVNFITKSNPSSPLLMKPEQLVVYNKKSEHTEVTTVPISTMNQWIDGSHFFNEQSLIEITNILEKSFDVRFIFRNKSRSELIFYADFRSDETLVDILDILSSSKKFSYRKKDDIIEIY